MKELFFETIDSTNTYLKKHVDELEDMTFLSSDYQSAGRGRNQRNWSSSKGLNLMFSLLIKDEKVLDQYSCLSILCAYSIIKVLEEYGVDDVMIKWPNDVFVRDGKICGILLEGISHERLEAVICGIGLNVNQTDFDGDMIHEPVSMKRVLNEDIDIVSLRKRVYQVLSENIEKLKCGYDFCDEICCYDYLKGKDVYALISGERKQVKVMGIDHDYSLRVNDQGRIVNLNSSEVTFHI